MNKIFKLMVLCTLLGCSMVLALTFFTAFTNESKSVIVTINEYNEMWIEALLIPIVNCLGIYLIYDELKEYKNE